MKKLTREFYKAHLAIPLRFLIVTAICVAVMYFTGTFSNETLRIPAIVVSAFLAAAFLWSLCGVLTAPLRFKKRLGALSWDERREITDGMETAKQLGKRWFSEKHLVYFSKSGIEFVRFDEILSADMRKNKLSLALSDGRELPFPFEANENPAVLVALLRSKNGRLAATIDGVSVDFDKKNKSEKRK